MFKKQTDSNVHFKSMFSFSKTGADEKERKKVKSLSHVRFLVTPWTVAYQAPPSMEFSRQEYCSGLPFPSPGDLTDPGIEPGSPALQENTFPSEPPREPPGAYEVPSEI